MRNWLVLIGLVVSPMTLGAPCDGAAGKNHKNPDGSQGGFVASTARVAPTVFVDASSSVCEQAKVQGNVKIKSASWIAGSASIEGSSEILSSRIYGISKVYGKAQVVNSAVCQASDINFKVSNSDYYCQTDDPEPKDPGELGKKTLMGIDSDTDGVRDDIEIWINTITSNQPEKDLHNTRMALKQVSLQMRKVLTMKNDISSLTGEYKKQLSAQDCLLDITNNDDTLLKQLAKKSFNTQERFEAYINYKSDVTGKVSYEVNNHRRFSSCNFKLR